MRTKRLIVIGIVLCATALRAAPDAVLSDRLFDDANAAFLAGDLARATAAYQALLEEGVASVELETNLGAALSRQNKRGAAALHLERALFLAPGDDDARADLTELRHSNVDRLEGDQEESGPDALFRFFAPLPGTAAALILLVAWSIACALVGVRLFSPTLSAHPAIVTSSWIAISLALLCGLVTAASAAAHKVALQRAVVIAESAPAREGPQARAASSFEVHEGTLVRIEEEQAGFARIRLQNGLVGWVALGAVEHVVPPRWTDR